MMVVVLVVVRGYNHGGEGGDRQQLRGAGRRRGQGHSLVGEEHVVGDDARAREPVECHGGTTTVSSTQQEGGVEWDVCVARQGPKRQRAV